MQPSNRYLKLAFIHLMRTGGAYADVQMRTSGYNLLSSWHSPYSLKRDWTKEEALELCKFNFTEPATFHNHVVNWDYDLFQSFKNHGWTTYTIIRDPREQLCSLFKYTKVEDMTLDEYIRGQASGSTGIATPHQHWALPEWWQEIDVVLEYQTEMFPVLQKYFGIHTPVKKRINARKHPTYEEHMNNGDISKEADQLLVSSPYYRRYMKAKDRTHNLLFLITSCQKNSEERSALRQTWIKDLKHPYYFVIGRKGLPSEIVDDILYVDCGDSYEDCPIKQYLSIKYVKENKDFEHLFCCDDDTYIYVDRLLECDYRRHDYYGGGPIYQQGPPLYVQGGAGFFLSPRAVQAVIDYPEDGEHIKCRWSDQMMGKIMHDAGIKAKYNKRFQMGFEEVIHPISRDYNRMVTSHKLTPDGIRTADIDINPFHVFDKIYWLQEDINHYGFMIQQFEDNDIEHLVTPIQGDFKDAVRDSKNCNATRILVLTEKDHLTFQARNVARYFFNEERSWKLMALGAEARRGFWHKDSVIRSFEVTKFSGLGIHSDWFDSFLEHEGSVETWLMDKEVFIPKRFISNRAKEFFHFPEMIPDIQVKKPIKCAMIVNNFKRGGAEIEFNEMMSRMDPEKVQWVGLACQSAFQFEISPDYKDHFPPVYVTEVNSDSAIDLEGVNICQTFEEAVLRACQDADVVIKWHVNHPVVEGLPHPSIALSNAFGRWVMQEYKHIRSNMQIGNSDHSGRVFWGGRSRTVYSGHAVERLQTHLGRDAQREKWGFGPDDKVIGYIGRVDMNKNLSTIVKAVALMPEEYKLVFVGQPVEAVFDEVKMIMEDYLPGRHFIDQWSHHVGDSLSGLDCFVLVSEYEGFSNSLAEAWMMEVPSVFSRCGAVMELEARYGTIGVTTNIGVKPEALVNKIKESMSDHNRPNIEKIGKIIREEFTIENSAKGWEQAIEDLYKQFSPQKRLRACVVLPNLDFGGTEIWLSTLMKCSQNCLIEWHFVKPKGEMETNQTILKELLPYGTFHIEGERFDFDHPNLNVYQTRKDLTRAFLMSDVIVVWGIPDLIDWFPDINKPVVITSQCHPTDQYHTNILEKNLSLGYRFAAISSESKEAYPSIIRRSADIIPNGFLPDHIFSNKDKVAQKKEWGFEEDDIVVGFVGRWCKEKNPLALGKALSALPKDFKGVYIGVTHSGPWSCEAQHYKDDMDKFMSREEQQRRLRYIPVQHKVADSLRGIDVLLMPSVKEGFCYVLIEAWANGIPVVSTNVGVFKDMYEIAGYPFGKIIDPHDGGDVMAERIKDALEMTPQELLDIKGHTLYRFNGITIAHRWMMYLNEVHNAYVAYSMESNIGDKLRMMLTKSSPKKVARELNLKGVLVPDGSIEWTYKSVLAFSAS